MVAIPENEYWPVIGTTPGGDVKEKKRSSMVWATRSPGREPPDTVSCPTADKRRREPATLDTSTTMVATPLGVTTASVPRAAPMSLVGGVGVAGGAADGTGVGVGPCGGDDCDGGRVPPGGAATGGLSDMVPGVLTGDGAEPVGRAGGDGTKASVGGAVATAPEGDTATDLGAPGGCLAARADTLCGVAVGVADDASPGAGALPGKAFWSGDGAPAGSDPSGPPSGVPGSRAADGAAGGAGTRGLLDGAGASASGP